MKLSKRHSGILKSTKIFWVMKYVTRGVMNPLKPKLLSKAGKELEANGEYLFFLKYGLTPSRWRMSSTILITQ
jgi:hypothetical protein